MLRRWIGSTWPIIGLARARGNQPLLCVTATRTRHPAFAMLGEVSAYEA